MAREDLHFRLRIPEALKAQIERSAAENNRSITAEIVARLDRSFEIDTNWDQTVDGVVELRETVEKLEEKVEKLTWKFRELDESLFPMKYEREK